MKKKLFALITALLLALGCLSGVAYADWTQELCYELQCVRTEEGLDVYLVALEDMTTAGLSAALSYDADAFELTSSEAAGGFTYSLNHQNGLLSLFSGGEPELKRGEALIVFRFHVTDAYSETAEYAFSLSVEEAFGFDLNDYAWVPADITAAWQEQQAPEAPAVPELGEGSETAGETGNAETFTVTYTDETGRILATETVEAGQEIPQPNAPAEAPEGMRFAGWEADGKPVEDAAEITEDLILVAVWEPVPEETEETAGADDPASSGETGAADSETAPAERAPAPAEETADGVSGGVVAAIVAAAVVVCGVAAALILRRRKK